MIILKSKKENFRMPKKEEETHTVSLSRVPPPGTWGRGALPAWGLHGAPGWRGGLCLTGRTPALGFPRGHESCKSCPVCEEGLEFHPQAW